MENSSGSSCWTADKDYQGESDDDDPFTTSDDSDSSSDSNGSGDEEDHVEEDYGDVPFTVPFNSITNEECFLSPARDLDFCVDLEDVVEDYFIVC